MTSQWLKLRWPITALMLGGMALAGVMRITHHPIQVRLMHSFAEPLQLGGRVQGQLAMPQPVQFEPSGSLQVKVAEQAPIDLSVSNKNPMQVQVSNPTPIQIKIDEDKPVQVEVDPQAPVKVKLGL